MFVREDLRERFGDDPRALLTELGVTHLLFVNRLGDHGTNHMIPEWIEGREPVFVVNPAGDGARVGEAKLPMEFEFAATAIWRVERPGPWVALYDVR